MANSSDIGPEHPTLGPADAVSHQANQVRPAAHLESVAAVHAGGADFDQHVAGRDLRSVDVSP